MRGEGGFDFAESWEQLAERGTFQRFEIGASICYSFERFEIEERLKKYTPRPPLLPNIMFLLRYLTCEDIELIRYGRARFAYLFFRDNISMLGPPSYADIVILKLF